MPKRIVNDTITLYRKGQQVVPEIGKEFDFTVEELADLNKLNPTAVSKVNEQEAQVEVTHEVAVSVADKPKAK